MGGTGGSAIKFTIGGKLNKNFAGIQIFTIIYIEHLIYIALVLPKVSPPFILYGRFRSKKTS